MIITGNNLRSLIRQHDLISEGAYDQFSLSLSIDKNILMFKDDIPFITYGQELSSEMYKQVDISDGFILQPREAILACSSEIVNMPLGYIGILQTKGSLARLFITIHCCDGQIESGFKGKITFEICNLGTIPIKFYPGQIIAQMYIFQTSSDDECYNGKYCNASIPTLSNKNYNK